MINSSHLHSDCSLISCYYLIHETASSLYCCCKCEKQKRRLDAGCRSLQVWCSGKIKGFADIVTVPDGAMSPSGEKGRTFTLDIGSNGAASLQEVILKKLTEFMGDYSDDVLAKYILVLVAHGKQQAQAVKDLEAFLGDRSESFVAWLWDYLCSNLHLHASVSKAPVSGSNGVDHKVQQADHGRAVQADVQVSSFENKHGEKMRQASNNTRNLPDLNEPPPKVGNMVTGSEIEKVEAKDRNATRHSRHRAKRPRSPLDTWTRKEGERRSDVKQNRKRHTSPQSVNATRRLLQSAVREAVAPVAGLIKFGSKRLRSVVLTEVDNLEDTNKNVVKVDDIRQEKTALPTLPVYTKAPELAAQSDKGPLYSVWDRLGRTAKHKKDRQFVDDLDPHFMRLGENTFMCRNLVMDDEGDNGKFLSMHQSRLLDQGLNDRNGCAAEKTNSEGPANDCEGGPHKMHEREGNHVRSQHFRGSGYQEMVDMGSKLVKSVDTESKRVSCANGPVRSVDTGTKGAQDGAMAVPSSRQSDSSQKHVMCSQGEQPGGFQVEQLQTQIARPEFDSYKDVVEMKKRLDQVQLEMMKLRAKQSDSNKEAQNVTSSALPGIEEASKMQNGLHSRTIYVTNIHFAATKEAIIAHFTQFGKVEQVVVLTDAATGKPKGSAYVEFSVPAEAEKALALNETSFYSRILKVVLRDSSNIQEMQASTRQSNPLPSRPSTRGRVFRSSHNTLGFASMRAAYSTPTKLQWKRDSTTPGGSPPVANGAKQANQGASVRPIVKSFTYVRGLTAPTVKAGSAEDQKGIT